MTNTLTTKELVVVRINALWRNVDALGGSGDDHFDKGWNAAISIALKELEKCGFFEDESEAADLITAQAAEIERLKGERLLSDRRIHRQRESIRRQNKLINGEGPRPFSEQRVVLSYLIKRRRDAEAKVAALEKVLNTPEVVDFVKAVQLEAAHQRERWGSDHDAGKTDADWFWLVGYLAGKALHNPPNEMPPDEARASPHRSDRSRSSKLAFSNAWTHEYEARN